MASSTCRLAFKDLHQNVVQCSLAHLFKCAISTREHSKSARSRSHLELALVHRVHDDLFLYRPIVNRPFSREKFGAELTVLTCNSSDDTISIP